jgi:hypothetical protein
LGISFRSSPLLPNLLVVLLEELDLSEADRFQQKSMLFFFWGITVIPIYQLPYRKHTNICNIPIYHCHTNILSSQYTNIHCHSISTLTFQETPFAKPRGAAGGGR